MALLEQDIKRVKGLGFLLNRGTEEFSGRIITENGILTAKQMQCLSEAAEKFGNGNITFTTSRLTVELPGISYDNIDPSSTMAGDGMVTGGTDPRSGRWSPAKAPPACSASTTPRPWPRRSTSGFMWNTTMSYCPTSLRSRWAAAPTTV